MLGNRLLKGQRKEMIASADTCPTSDCTVAFRVRSSVIPGSRLRGFWAARLIRGPHPAIVLPAANRTKSVPNRGKNAGFCAYCRYLTRLE